MMKKLVIMSLTLMITYGSVFAVSTDFPINSKTWGTLSHNLEVINACNLTDNDLNEIMLGHHPEIAVEFAVQTKLPINFFLKGDLFNLVENENNVGVVEVMQTFYVRCTQQELIFSTDLTDWKPFLEFLTGHASVSLNIQDGTPSIVVGAETNRRP